MHYDKRSMRASDITMFGVSFDAPHAENRRMLSADELLAALRERGVKNAEIAELLDLPSSRVSELFSGKRRLQLDEAKKLVERYQLEDRVNPLSLPIARLLVLYGADALDVDIAPDDPRVEELARDFRAFSMFANDPRVRESEEVVQAFFQGLRLAPGRTSEGRA